MKKLFLILIYLFVSFEVNSEERVDFIDMKDCLKYLDKGKVLHKVESKVKGSLVVDTLFTYKQKTYQHRLNFNKNMSMIVLDDSYCLVYDFDIDIEKE